MSLYSYPSSLVLNTEALWRRCQEAIYYFKSGLSFVKLINQKFEGNFPNSLRKIIFYCYGKIFYSVHFALQNEFVSDSEYFMIFVSVFINHFKAISVLHLNGFGS